MSEPLRCLTLNGTLKADGPSSTQVLLDQVAEALTAHDVVTETVRLVEHDVKPGVEADMGAGDAWPGIRERILAADILVLGTPIWLGNPSSVIKRAMERIDAFLSETDDAGRFVTSGKVAGVAVTGNEDGAHNSIAQLYQGLVDAGFSVPNNGATYWVGEAMQGTDYRELDEVPDNVASTTALMATNLAHLARLLRDAPYPPPS